MSTFSLFVAWFVAGVLCTLAFFYLMGHENR